MLDSSNHTPPACHVFICYAHESHEHKRRVLALATLLTEHNIHVDIDQWDLHERRDWQLWATQHIHSADHVLVVASPTCRKVGDGLIRADHHRGLQSEMALLRDFNHSRPAEALRKLLPVIPGPLRSRAAGR